MNILLYPPFAFIISLAIVLLFGKLIKGFEPRFSKSQQSTKTYACGEEFEAKKLSPGYEEFYPYAIFFTVLHVVAIMLMTIAFTSSIPISIPIIYLLVIIVILSILFI